MSVLYHQTTSSPSLNSLSDATMGTTPFTLYIQPFMPLFACPSTLFTKPLSWSTMMLRPVACKAPNAVFPHWSLALIHCPGPKRISPFMPTTRIFTVQSPGPVLPTLRCSLNCPGRQPGDKLLMPPLPQKRFWHYRNCRLVHGLVQQIINWR